MTFDQTQLKKILPTNLEVFRGLKNISQHDLAQKLDPPKRQAQLSHYEAGIHKPDAETLKQLKELLDFPLDAVRLLDPFNAADFELENKELVGA